MPEIHRDRVLAAFNLTTNQRDAVIERNKDVAVTAGAGSGKTSTLVARYASLLADGIDLRRIVAITFSDKAAREMRSRVRETLDKLVKQSASSEERENWSAMNARMDAARIGTIHGLCAEILRAHPVEALVDPRFGIIKEGLQKALLIKVVEDTMTDMVGMLEFEPLFQILETGALSKLLAFLLEKRLDVQEAFQTSINVNEVICGELKSILQTPEFVDCITDLGGNREPARQSEDIRSLAPQVEDLLSLWSKAEDALSVGDAVACAGFLNKARREKMNLAQLRGYPEEKESVENLRTVYDNLLNPICGGKTKKDVPPDTQTEAKFATALQLIKHAFGFLSTRYHTALRERGELDFDDLEDGAWKLLKNPAIRDQWQGQIDALLVDEFQDTNKRQLEIVKALAGSKGRLFVVGDAKQSIYRFRRADVTVFRSVQEQTRSRGGLHIDLDRTFRAHEPLLDVMGDLLREAIGTEEDPSRPYYIPFTPMTAHRKTSKEWIHQPHTEFVYGTGKNAKKARPDAARALAERLLELKGQGQIQYWDDVTLLFRASTGFLAYENAFEEVNIPFVTVAGRGFYDRAEIRDVLNILRAVANLTDDLSMAGLLRSPAFGLTDAALYQMRWQCQPPAHYWNALHGDLSYLSVEDRSSATRALFILDGLIPLVDRIPVAVLLKKLVDDTDYRSILATGDHSGAGGRLWRNLDKLISDARDSGVVNVRDFLKYLITINDAGARSGEAPAEAQGSVRLMTTHKAKGLQYPIVVLADASHAGNRKPMPAFLLPDLGFAFKLDPEPMLYRLAKIMDKMQNDAEEQRVLYVALTRVQEKLIISGYSTFTKKQGWKTAGWMEVLGDAAGVDVNAVIGKAGTECLTQTVSAQQVRAWAPPPERVGLRTSEIIETKDLPVTDEAPIYAPLVEAKLPLIVEDESLEIHTKRTTGTNVAIPPGVLGKMVHKAVELWIFPSDLRLIPLLETSALNSGMAVKIHRDAAVNEAVELLSRLMAHPIRKEIEAAQYRYHELPYTRMAGDRPETGYIDLLYQDCASWKILDFKTDTIRSAEHRTKLIKDYSNQMKRYTEVVESMLGLPVQTRICFLDHQGEVELVSI